MAVGDYAMSQLVQDFRISKELAKQCNLLARRDLAGVVGFFLLTFVLNLAVTPLIPICYVCFPVAIGASKLSEGFFV